MTDKETLQRMLQRANITYALDRTKETERGPREGQMFDVLLVTGGYSDFFSEFMFADDGALLAVRAWE